MERLAHTPVDAQLAQPRTIERPYREFRGYSVMNRRAIQIANLRFKLEHAEDLKLTPRKIERMEDALDSQEHAQTRYRFHHGRNV